MSMKEFYAEECGEDYGVLCYQEQTRQSVTKELLQEILNVEIIEFEIDFDLEIITYGYMTEWYTGGSISINDFFEKAYELDEN